MTEIATTIAALNTAVSEKIRSNTATANKSIELSVQQQMKPVNRELKRIESALERVAQTEIPSSNLRHALKLTREKLKLMQSDIKDLRRVNKAHRVQAAKHNQRLATALIVISVQAGLLLIMTAALLS